jgi:diguanylate cyclase (GGDEF)-like protein
MRRLALLGLVVSLVLGAVAVFQTSESVRARRDDQDRSLQAAIGSETARISDGVRQATTALSLMLVNPAVRQLLSEHSLPAGERRRDLASAALALRAIRRFSLVPLSAACLDDGHGHQLTCAATGRPALFAPALGRSFLQIADASSGGAASGAFLSPISGQRSVAFLAPFRVEGRPVGFVHMDISLTDASGPGLVVNATPGVKVRLARDEGDQVVIRPRAAAGGAASAGTNPTGEPGARVVLPLAGALSAHPQSTFDRGNRAMVAALPLTSGPTRRTVAVAAIAVAQNPAFLNAWSSGMLIAMAVAILTLIGSIVGLAVSHRRVAHELLSDPLTELRNRRALLEELPRACRSSSEEEPTFLWFFDLNGFKSYNDSFGHLAGDSLLARLGQRLRETVAHHGSVYRLGGDEFCVLVSSPIEDPHALFVRAREALTEKGGAFTVTAAAGAVELPREADEPTQALRLADQRMYREKATSRGGAAELITAVLHAALAQRHPDLGEHSDDVAGDVEMLSRAIGLEEETISLIIKAGDLHDVGKLGIPDEILTKPGPLSEEEWEFMRQHTVMGEQIIAAAGPSLERIGPLVRASHERWDGKGYPDGLAGEEIPLGARIITICDSFRAMLDERVYKEAMPLTEALAELRRCAGTQFDPDLVEVFCDLVAEGVERADSVRPRARRAAAQSPE